MDPIMALAAAVALIILVCIISIAHSCSKAAAKIDQLTDEVKRMHTNIWRKLDKGN